MELSQFELMVSAYHGTVVSQRSDGVYGFFALRFESQYTRDTFRAAARDYSAVHVHEVTEHAVRVDVLLPYDRATSW